jgi:hypothetical protein
LKFNTYFLPTRILAFYQYESRTGSGSGSRVLMTKNGKKTNSGSKIKIYFASIKDVQAIGKASVLKRENPALQNMKFF